MQKYNGTLLRKFDDPVQGNASVGTSVVVRKKSDNSLAPIYSIDDINSIQKPNPFTTDAFGRYSFFAPNGKYILQFGDGSDEIEISMVDNLDHNGLLQRNASGAHDAIYSRIVSVADIAVGDLEIGIRVSVSDRDYETFEIIASGTIDGKGVLDAGGGKVAVYRPNKAINPKAVGARHDGITDDTSANNYAAQLAVALLMPVKAPYGTSVTETITTYTGLTWIGAGIHQLKYVSKKGTNTDVFQSLNANSLFGTGSADGVHNLTLRDFSIDGNRNRVGNSGGNTSGSGIVHYGRSPTFRNIEINQCATNGMHTGWGDGPVTKVLEGKFSSISIMYTGEHGWRFRGPHDSHCTDILIISASQKATGVYDGLRIDEGNARWSNLHIWSFSTDDLGNDNISVRHAHDLYVSGGAGFTGGNEFALSHFEGGNINVYNGAANTTFEDSCKFYYPWAGKNIVNDGASCVIKGILGEEFKGLIPALPSPVGVTFGSTYGGVSNTVVDLVGTGIEAGYMDFGGSAGANSIKIRGYSAGVSSIGYLGSPQPSDDVDIYIGGGNLTILKKSPVQTAHPVATLIPQGTVQSDAQEIYKYTRYVKVVTTSPSAGLRMANPSIIGSGNALTIFNKTASTIKLYPSIGGNLLGFGVDNPVSIPALKTLDVIVDDVNAGTFLVAGPY